MNAASWKILEGDCRATLRTLPAGHFHTAVSSPPYWGLRDYGLPPVQWDDGSLCCFGLEPSIDLYLAHTVEVCREIRRVLRDDGTLWWNIGDSYADDSKWGGATGGKHVEALHGEPIGRRRNATGLKPGDLCNIPHRVAAALQADGWFWRSTIIWAKRSPMPESVSGWRWIRCRVKVANGTASDEPSKWAHEDRPHSARGDDGRNFDRGTKWQPCPGCSKCEANGGYILRQGRWRPTNAHEYIFLFSKSEKYFCDGEAVKEALAEASKQRQKSGRKNQWGHIIDANSHVEKRSFEDAKSYGPDHMPTGRNPRSVWSLSAEPFKGAHFATFPTALPRKCIEAATSSAGCCPTCGSQFAPVVESERVATRPGNDNQIDETGMANRDAQRHVAVTRTLGYRATCNCNAGEAVPCRVLDPFNGSGTTGQVAFNLGRDYVGCEQNQEYIELAKVRIVTPLKKAKAASVRRSKRKPVKGQKELFA